MKTRCIRPLFGCLCDGDDDSEPNLKQLTHGENAELRGNVDSLR